MVCYISKPNEWFDEGTVVKLIDDYRSTPGWDCGLFCGFRNGKIDEEVCTFDEFEIQPAKLMRWIRFKSTGKFHLVLHSFDLKPSVKWSCDRKQYEFVCEMIVIADPNKVAARGKIYESGIDEYCQKCLEIYNGN